MRICTHCQAWYGGMTAPIAAPTVVPMSNGMETRIYDSDPERDTMYRNPMIEWMERYDCGYESENASSGTAGTVNGTVSGSESVEGQRLSTSLTLPDPSPVETSFQGSSRVPAAEDTEGQPSFGESTEWFGIGGSDLATGDQTRGEDQDQAQRCIPAIADGVGVDFAAVEGWREVTLEERAGTEATLEEESEENNAIGKVDKDDEEEGDGADTEPLRLPIILKADNENDLKTGDDL